MTNALQKTDQTTQTGDTDRRSWSVDHRGGRLTKFKGQVASLAPAASGLVFLRDLVEPFLGAQNADHRSRSMRASVSSLATIVGLAAGLSGSAALAQDICSDAAAGAGSGIYVCDGTSTTQQAPTALTGGDLDVTAAQDTSISVTAGSGVFLENSRDDGGISFTDSGGLSVTTSDASRGGVEVRHFGTGVLDMQLSDATITHQDQGRRAIDLTAGDESAGIELDLGTSTITGRVLVGDFASSDVVLTSEASITAFGEGGQQNQTAVTVFETFNSRSSDFSIIDDLLHEGDITVNVGGSIETNMLRGLFAGSSTNGQISVTHSGTITNTRARGIEIYSENRYSNAILYGNYAPTYSDNYFGRRLQPTDGIELHTTADSNIQASSSGIILRNTNDFGGTRATIEGRVHGRSEGVYVFHYGFESDAIIEVTESGAVSSDLGPALNLFTYDFSAQQLDVGGVDVDVAGTVLSEQDSGIYVFHSGNVSDGSSGIDITVAESGQVTGSNEAAIRVRKDGYYSQISNFHPATNISIEVAGVVTGLNDASGIEVDNIEGGVNGDTESSTTIMVSGTVTADHDGINTHAGENVPGDTTITVATGGLVQGNNNGIIARNDGAADAIITVSGEVAGGSASGIALQTEGGTNTIDVLDGGRVGALSDHAISVTSGQTMIDNSGTVTGFVTLADGADTFTNRSANSWNIRNFADTDFDGVRDTEGVAVSDFGAGADTFENTSTGAVRLLTVEDMTGFTVETDDDTTPTNPADQTGEFAPAVADQPRAAGDITVAGIEQGQILNLEVFDNAGLITMADADTGGTTAVAGDILVITGSDTAGTSAGGQFISNGGALHIDTVLNDGVVDETDLLVVDDVIVGSGPTLITVTNAGGTGGNTDLNGDGIFDVDEGILVVQQLENDAGADADAFALAGGVVAGLFEYVLDQTDGQNWFLHSLARPFVPVYELYPHTLLDMVDLGTRQQRLGNRVWGAAPEEPVFVFCKDPEQNFRCQVTPEQSEVFADSGTGLSFIEGEGAWINVEGMQRTFTPAEATYADGYESQITGVQLGYDWVLQDRDDGSRLIGGLNAVYRDGTTEVTSGQSEAGTIATTGIGLGASLTYYDLSGLYVDAQARVMQLESTLSSPTLGAFLTDHTAMSYGLSVEAGKEMAISETWTLIPQVQLSYSTVEADDATDGFGNDITLRAESLQLRGGVEAVNRETWEESDGTTSRRDIRIGAHVTQELSPEQTITVAGTDLTSQAEATMAEITLGGTYNWKDDSRSIYGEISAAAALDNPGDNNSIRGTVGLRVQW